MSRHLTMADRECADGRRRLPRQPSPPPTWRRQRRDRPRVRHDGRRGRLKPSHRPRRSNLSFLRCALPRQIHRRPRQVSRTRGGVEPAAAERHDLHLPDASGNPAGRTRKLSDLRHGAGAIDDNRRNTAQPRIRRYDQTLLDRSGTIAAGGRVGHGRAPAVARHTASPACHGIGLGPTPALNPRRPLGRLAILPASLGVGREPQPQHVQSDRFGHRRRVSLQPGRDLCAGFVPVGVPRHGQCGSGLFRIRIGHHRSRPSRPGSRIARARANRRSDPRIAQPRAKDGVALDGQWQGRRRNPCGGHPSW